MSIFTNRMQREANTIRAMVRIYCQHHHEGKTENCPECSQIQNYALDRLYYCPFQEGKTSCKNCPVHCYKPSMKDDIKRVMRYSGPRMALRHPMLTIFHFIDERRREPAHSTTGKEFKKTGQGMNNPGRPNEACEHL
ncbi:MAG: nitrous oxide-stimulated promoter family protein [Candidatus Marinimicrobia bacterium]|nr:nitrous oxide-stimulated promoter family protein [Candidatus Neomarinimicrobiota bacterium]